MTAPNPEFWRGKRVFLTGHTGFKGAWASLLLARLGAEVTGYALAPEAEESLFALAGCDKGIDSRIGDIRDRAALAAAVADARPDIVLHMAAQALVRRSYAEPVETWQTNVDGTLHLLEALKPLGHPPVVLVITSDKVYRNDETGRPFIEEDPLGGHDPYSASKAACEILTASWRDCFAADHGIRLASARAGNVIGGGDFSLDRIVPDIWRAVRDGQELQLRNPGATRPWQHVLDCLNGYLLYIEALAGEGGVPLSLNFGPADSKGRTVREIAEDILSAIRPGSDWAQAADTGPREMAKLTLDTSRARALLGWTDHLAGARLSTWTADWYRACAEGADMRAQTLSQIDSFLNNAGQSQ
ncbi:CDP-glucose 4,6-dehydratase [Stappia taiwanensis]|uniref:CDP-glucose 4,6-dehydratase n=1 Tax=Stappia taiwanensis TaxID=992267 RepID=A0A838Y0S3_9HYPH|nr:CDP-glucose 4,6-dehydratase [Stappia taiwanensis]MBA4612653.1 CDP-glucose 4,6-dehydratase [Stappia taiwanensis]GGE88733.1 CDP-glucose 4,6-dehydratase [Stappia taiwanensis]